LLHLCAKLCAGWQKWPPKPMSKIKKILKIIAIAALLVAGGAAGGLISFYQCAQLAPLYLPSALSSPKVEKSETVIQENKALKDAIVKVKNMAIAVKIGGDRAISGAVITSDGLTAVPNDSYPAGVAAEVFSGGEKIGFEVVGRDKDANLAILRLQAADLFTAGFYQQEDLPLGERVFLVGVSPSGEFFANEGMVRAVSGGRIVTNIYDTAAAAGAPVFDIEGNFLGIAQVAESGQVAVISVAKIKKAAGL